MLMACIIATTLIFVALYKYRCSKAIYAVLVTTYALVLGSWFGFLVYELVRRRRRRKRRRRRRRRRETRGGGARERGKRDDRLKTVTVVYGSKER